MEAINNNYYNLGFGKFLAGDTKIIEQEKCLEPSAGGASQSRTVEKLTS